MRLLDASTRRLKLFPDEAARPAYAILSHTWGEEEVTLQDLDDLHQNGTQHQSTHPTSSKSGYYKIDGCCTQALYDGLQWAWVDTCCIDKTDPAEVSEAVNSMFQWYKDSSVCYVYLADVPSRPLDYSDPECAFHKSRWFTRGWTLQELLAPSRVRMFDTSFRFIGQISENMSLAAATASITSIQLPYLTGEAAIETASVAQRMSWAARRVTTKEEDQAYCLIWIFGVNMPLLYGEGHRAFFRLQEEIMKVTDDHSIFAWDSFPDHDNHALNAENECSVLASSPYLFLGPGNVGPVPNMPRDTTRSEAV